MPVCKYRPRAAAAAAAALLQAQTGLIFAAHTLRTLGWNNKYGLVLRRGQMFGRGNPGFSLWTDYRGTGKLPVESFVDEKAFFLFDLLTSLCLVAPNRRCLLKALSCSVCVEI